MTKYATFIRGLNVGGKSQVKMSELKSVLEKSGFNNVQTLIQSGNIIFDNPGISLPEVSKKVEEIILEHFGIKTRTVVVDAHGLKRIISESPADWTTDQDIRKYIAFTIPPVTPQQFLKVIHPNPNVDRLSVGPGVVYLTTKLEGLSRSAFAKIISSEIYAFLTVRNYNTVHKVAAAVIT